MYSDKVTGAVLELVEKRTGVKLKRYTERESISPTKEIIKIYKDSPKNPELNEDLATFARNEYIISRYDWRYWLKYCHIEYDGCEGGGVGIFRPWEAQNIVIDKIAKIEETQYEHYVRKEPADGILIADHKSRQLGGTALGGAFMVHRLTLTPDTRGMAASVDNDKIQELYDRHKTIIDNLPPFLKPALDTKSGDYDTKAGHIRFNSINSRLLYQDSQQKGGMGQGRQFDIGQLTECSSWAKPEHDIELAFFPTLPQNWSTFCMLESQAMFRDNWWHEFTERCRKGFVAGWNYIFVPWYAEPKKYRRVPPVNWKPSEATMSHAFRVYESSQEFLGRKVMLGKEQLYWYETTRENYLKSDSLNVFLTCYAATPEESFQHAGQSAFSAMVLERMDHSVRRGLSYDLFVNANN